jgi:hypothetical protein
LIGWSATQPRSHAAAIAASKVAFFDSERTYLNIAFLKDGEVT